MPTTPLPAQSAEKLTDAEKITHLLNRAAFGPWYGDVDRIRQIGIELYIEEQLHPQDINDSPAESRLDTLKAVGARLPAGFLLGKRAALQQLQAQKLIRGVYSLRQLQEVMVDFWFNHFNVFWGKDRVQELTARYEYEVIRPNALGRFKDLLLATAKHPAMLIYLDNALSSSAGINENYAREVMELHTMGVDGGYTQQDVEEVARCFTGWTVDSSQGATTFRFGEDIHDRGDKTVLGQTIHSGGYDEGESVLTILVRHPNTARFIATKLVRRFVADDPPRSLVDRVADVFTRTDGDIREMLRAILTSDEFFSASVFRAKAKSPFEVVASTLRAVNADIDFSGEIAAGVRVFPGGIIMFPRMPMQGTAERAKLDEALTMIKDGSGVGVWGLLDLIEQMGHFLYQYEAPTGYPDRSGFWMSGWTVLHRMRFAAAIAANDFHGISVDAYRLATLFEGDPNDAGARKTALGVLSGMVYKPEVAPTPHADAGPSPQANNRLSKELTEAFALALGSPEFQHK